MGWVDLRVTHTLMTTMKILPRKWFSRFLPCLLLVCTASPVAYAQSPKPKPQVSPRPSPGVRALPGKTAAKGAGKQAGPIDGGIAQLIPSDNPLETLGGLQWTDTNLKVLVDMKDGVPMPFVQLRGRLQRDGWGLFYGKTWLLKASSTSREFQFRVNLTGEETVVLVGGAGPNRKTQRIIVRVAFKDFSKFGGAQAASRARFRLVAAIGPSYVTYQETTGPFSANFNTIILTAKLTARYELAPKKWDIGFNTYYSLLQLTNGYTDKNVKTRFLGVNLRLGYTFPTQGKWSFGLNTGWYYTTMFVTSDTFGFRNMAGPQLYPLLIGQLSGGKVLSFYAKYSPIIGLGFGNREIAGGMGYSIPLKNGHPIIFNLDYANVSFDIIGQQTASGERIDTAIRSSSISLSAGYGF